MNPLSAHPPRTPKTSIINSSSAVHIYGQSIYEPKEDMEPAVVDKEEYPEELDEEEVEQKSAGKVRVRKDEVWRDLFLTSNGRDKAFLLLLFNWLGPLTAIKAQQSVPYSAEVSTEKSKKTTRPFLHTVLYAPPPVLLELVHSVSDDVATLSVLGLFGKKLGERAGRFSDWCWLLATLVGLVENGVERQMIGNLQHAVESRLYSESMSGATSKSKPKDSKLDETELSRLRKQDYWLQITRTKLMMDLIFVCACSRRVDIARKADDSVAYDVFRIKRFAETVQTTVGLTAAILRYDLDRKTLMPEANARGFSALKLYNGQRNIILKKLL
ncbi:hypothetical protein DXG03_000002 [Asterophora parasitica]|uniref:Uncharacterized protein n=1 Tax=Asterophora parasitica TaxID=117018 RepID=A0A9P7KE17_9AGAR|nr:hypothetical protein DXG03_000002 [Asterophora parasitica]